MPPARPATNGMNHQPIPAVAASTATVTRQPSSQSETGPRWPGTQDG